MRTPPPPLKKKVLRLIISERVNTVNSGCVATRLLVVIVAPIVVGVVVVFVIVVQIPVSNYTVCIAGRCSREREIRKFN